MWAGDLEGVRDVAGGCAAGADADEMAEHGKPRVLCQCGKCRERVNLFHISTTIEIISPRSSAYFPST